MRLLCLSPLLLSPVFLWACASVPAPPAVDASPALLGPPAAQTVDVRVSETLSKDLFQMIDTVTLAVEARAKGETVDALNLFHQAWLADTSNLQIIQEYSALALKLGDADAAMHAYKNIKIDFDAAPPALIANYVLAEIATGRVDDIELSLNLALERNLQDPRLWSALGQFYDKQAEHMRAQDHYIKALKMGGPKAAIINNMGMSLLLQGRREAALKKFEHAIELDQDNQLFDNNRRLVLALQADYQAATEGLTDHRAADILNDAGYIALQRGEMKLAARLLEHSIRLSPRHHQKAQANLEALGQ